MIELSLNEVETLAAKVGRGGGFSWGLAEEIGRSARKLARGGFPWAEALLLLAEKTSGLQPPSLAQAELWREHLSAMRSTTTLCPVRTAALLIDDPTILKAKPLHLENVGVPIWIVGMLAASNAASAFEINWLETSALAAPQGAVPKTPSGAWLAPDADVGISPVTAPSRQPSLLRRALADDAILAALESFAARVYVPASESSRARGAGGGSVDDE